MTDEAKREIRQMLRAALDPGEYSAHPDELLDSALEGWSIHRKLIDPRDIADPARGVEEVDKLVRYMITVTRTETVEERDARLQLQETRLGILTWRPKDGPPPEGVGMGRLLEQKTWWAPKGEPPIKIVDMSGDHRAYLLAFLERNAERIQRTYTLSLRMSIPDDIGDEAGDLLDRDIAVLGHTAPLEWLHGMPLVKALRKLDKR